jgi:hypothetical protein
MTKGMKKEKHTVRWRLEVWNRMERIAGKRHITEFANNAAWVFQRNEMENIKEKKKELARELWALQQKMKIIEEWEKAAVAAKEKKDD